VTDCQEAAEPRALAAFYRLCCGGHPNSLRNLRPFRKGYDPRRCQRTPDDRPALGVRQRQTRFQAVCNLLVSDELPDDLRADLSLQLVREILNGALSPQCGVGRGGRERHRRQPARGLDPRNDHAPTGAGAC
jgi:hypothetical protein